MENFSDSLLESFSHLFMDIFSNHPSFSPGDIMTVDVPPKEEPIDEQEGARSSDSENEVAGDEVTDEMVREAAALWASDYKKGDPPPIGIHRVGNKNPPMFRATVTINSRPYHGPIRDTIEECIVDRRKMLIQYKRVTRMKGKRKTNPKYFEDEPKDDSSSVLPYVTHVIELLNYAKVSPKPVPARHLCPVVLSMRVAGVQIQDSFIWSALMVVDQNTTADLYGYGQTHLQAYCVGLLSDYNICPTLDNLNHVVTSVSQQLDFSRAATLIPEESSLLEKGKYRKFPPAFNAALTDEASGYNERLTWNAWAPDATVKKFCDDVALQWNMAGKSRLDLEFQLLSQAIAHRQKFLDANPHINTGIQRIFRKQEVKQAPEVRSQKVLERIARLHKMRMARKCFRNLDTAKPNVPKPEAVEESDGGDSDDDQQQEDLAMDQT
jgi:hypothetical protein